MIELGLSNEEEVSFWEYIVSLKPTTTTSITTWSLKNRRKGVDWDSLVVEEESTLCVTIIIDDSESLEVLCRCLCWCSIGCESSIVCEDFTNVGGDHSEIVAAEYRCINRTSSCVHRVDSSIDSETIDEVCRIGDVVFWSSVDTIHDSSISDEDSVDIFYRWIDVDISSCWISTSGSSLRDDDEESVV